MIPHNQSTPVTAASLGIKNPLSLKKVPGLKQVKGLYRSANASGKQAVDENADPDGKFACVESTTAAEAQQSLRDQGTSQNSSSDVGGKRKWFKATKSAAYEVIPPAKNVGDASHDLEADGCERATGSSQSRWASSKAMKAAASAAASATVNVTVKAAKNTASATKKVAKVGKKGAKKGYDMLQSATEKPSKEVIERKGLKENEENADSVHADLEIGESAPVEELKQADEPQENGNVSHDLNCPEASGAGSRLLGGVARTIGRATDAAAGVKVTWQEKARDVTDAEQHTLQVAVDSTQHKVRDAGPSQVAKAAKESVGRVTKGVKESVRSKTQGASAKVAKVVDSAKGNVAQAKGMVVSRRRLARFAIAFLSGLFILGIAFGFLPALAFAPHKFALPFAFGSVLLLASFAILKGTRKFAQGIIKPAKLPYTLAYAVGLVGTLCSTLIARSYLLTLVFGLLQAVGLTYFIATGVPGGKKALHGLGKISRKLASKAMRTILRNKR